MLGTTAEHALRALTALAVLPEDEVMLGRDLAESASIPPNYLSKILWSLRNAGVIQATRGSGGGYRLARPASEIRLFDVVDLFDKTRTKSTCLLGLGRACSDENACPAHKRWRRVRGAYTDFLMDTTIADIAKNGR
jgi:Rrf2 family protein